MNEAMGTVVGELIQMNAKMVVTKDARECIVIGVLACATMLFWTLFMIRAKKRAIAIVLGLIALGCGALAVHGATMPRVKEIHACVNGPISLERVSAVYDIVEIDGKEIVLRER